MPASLFKSVRFRWLGLLSLSLCVFMALTPPPSARAEERGQLLKEVVLSRHGVRSPMQSAERLAGWSERGWPEWPVKPGMQTERGSSLIFRQWREEAARLASLGVKSEEVFICADSEQRTRAAAEAIARAFSPSGDIVPPLSYKAEVYPIFHPVRAGLSSIDKGRAESEILKGAGGSLEALRLTLSGELGQLAAIMGPLPSHTLERYKLRAGSTIITVPSSVVFPDGGRSAAISGGLGAASSAAEIFMLEYCQWPEGRAGWGEVNGEVLENIMPVHSLIFNIVQRAPSVALAQAANLTELLAAALLSDGSGLTNIPTTVKTPALAAKLSIFVGHDTNIAGTAQLLGLNWELPGFAPNDVPPGSCLVLSLWQRGGERYVTAEFTGLSLATLHGDASAPTRVNRQRLSLAHMSGRDGAEECSPEEFADWVRRATAKGR